MTPEQLDLLIDDYLDGRLSAEQCGDLEQGLLAGPAAMDRLITAGLMHCLLQDRYAAEAQDGLHDLIDVAGADTAEAEGESVMDLVVDLALAERRKRDLEDDANRKLAAQQADDARNRQLELSEQTEPDPAQRVIIIPRVVVWGSIAAILLLGLFLVLHNEQSTPANRPVTNNIPPVIAAVFETDFDSAWASPSPPSLGQTMAEGDYHLIDGRAKLRFQNGALVVIEAPARFTLDSGSSMTVHAGQVVAYCDAQAHGFLVRTPNAEFVDLGTEFGIRVIPGKESQLHVFKGKVRARAVSNHANESIVVHEAQAVTAILQGTSLIALTKAEEHLFATTRRVEIPVANTGERLREDDGGDLNWQVTHVSDQLLAEPASTHLFTPPAYMPARPNFRFHPNVPGRISWITIDPLVAGANEESYTFQTRFEVHDMDMESLQLEMGFRADNYVAHIRLNGRSVAVPGHAHVPPFDSMTFVRIEEGFVIGENILEVVIGNSINSINPESNYAALIAELKLTAQADWKQTADFRPAADE